MDVDTQAADAFPSTLPPSSQPLPKLDVPALEAPTQSEDATLVQQQPRPFAFINCVANGEAAHKSKKPRRRSRSKSPVRVQVPNPAVTDGHKEQKNKGQQGVKPGGLKLQVQFVLASRGPRGVQGKKNTLFFFTLSPCFGRFCQGGEWARLLPAADKTAMAQVLDELLHSEQHSGQYCVKIDTDLQNYAVRVSSAGVAAGLGLGAPPQVADNEMLRVVHIMRALPGLFSAP